MKILVIIVTYNAMQWAERCFDSLRKSTIVPDVFVVDNGSTDGTQAYLHEHYPNVLFQQSLENLGFGKANNFGLQYALDNNYDYVYLLNQDAWVMPDTFEKLLIISRDNPEYGILSPFQMEANMEHLDCNFKKYSCAWKSSPNLVDYLYLGSDKAVYPVKRVMAAHWLITRKCLLCIGGFSPTFPHYGEDENYCDRVNYHGLKTGIVPSVKAIHDRENRKDSVDKVIYMYYINALCSLSNPLISTRFVDVIMNLTALIIKFKRVIPIRYIYCIIKSYSKIRYNKLQSIKKEHAFLNANVK